MKWILTYQQVNYYIVTSSFSAQTLLLISLYWSLSSAVPMETGSQEPSHWSSRPWRRSWRPTPPCMCWGSASARVCSSTPPSPLSPTCPHRTTESSSPTRSFGLWTTPMCTESPSTRWVRHMLLSQSVTILWCMWCLHTSIVNQLKTSWLVITLN